MMFRITRHAGHEAPPDAIDQLLAKLSGRGGNGRFNLRGSEIRVTWGNDDGGWGRPERQELEREELLDLLRETCQAESGLRLDWYAVGPLD